MARFTSNHVRPAKAVAKTDDKSAQETTRWNTLDELRQMMMSNGCTKAQFDEAIETVGNNPHRVASYLQRYEFSNSLTEKGKIG